MKVAAGLRIDRGRTLLAALAALALAGGGPGAPDLLAQGSHDAGGVRDRNGHPFRTPAISNLEPIHRLAIVGVRRDTARRSAALAELGDRLEFWIHRRPRGRFELAGAIHAGAFSRFDLETPQNDFIEIHYRVGFLLRARYRGIAARAELYHVSSHLGDEFLGRTGRAPVSTSREGLSLLMQVSPWAGAIVYGGGGILVSSAPDFDSPELRGGFEWEGATAHRARPYVGFELRAWSELDWEPSLAAEAGAALGRNARLGVLLGLGPSRAEQFLRENETLFGVTFSYRR